MASTYVLDLDYQRLLDFSNGVTIRGFTISKVASATTFTTQVSGVYQQAWDVGQALTVLGAANPAWTVENVVAESAKVVWYVSATF